MKRFLFTLLLIVLIAGCGGGGGDVKSDVSPDEITDTLTAAEKILYSDSYEGHLVVHFNETLKMRLDGQRRLYSKSGESAIISQIQSILDAYPTAKIKRSVTTSPEQLDRRREELEELSGKRLADFNSIYHIQVSDPDTALQVMRALGDIGTVDNIYPGQESYLFNLTSTPDLTSSHQGYLYSESTHGGLNAEAAWNQGIYGQDVMLVDAERAWNFDHLDLPLAGRPDINMGITPNPPCIPSNMDPDCQNALSHGTAVVGILAAQNNTHGVTGFAPDATTYVAGITPGMLVRLTDGDETNRELPPGSVFLIESGWTGAFSSGTDCNSDPYGCVPFDASEEVFDSIETAVAAGVTVVSAAGNGSVDLGDSTVYYSYQKDLSQYDSGSILVGASQGANEQKKSNSNYGSPIDCFAWGEGVVTTGYQCNAPGTACELYSVWNGTTTPIPPNTDPNAYFIDLFNGTSAAAPMVAGAAALVQSYAKNVMGETTRYLMPGVMRQILVNSGVAQAGGGGYIGMQPRIDVAMGMVDTQWATWSTAYPKLLTNTQFTQQEMLDLRADGLGIICKPNDPQNSDPCCPDEGIYEPGTGVAETLDFDGDGRADLVSWERGSFKLDLSTTGGDVDGFGAWDVIINYPTINSGVVWPYVEDINSDGREDLVLYDKEHGTWYISYTTSAMLSGSGFHGWDHIITTNVQDQLDMDPSQSMYCRPQPGDYDGDGYVDLAAACSDGVWYIAHSPGIADPQISSIVEWPASGSIAYDEQVQYLTAQQLSEAPGWAYLTAVRDYSNIGGPSDIMFKAPDGVADVGRVVVLAAPDFVANSVSAAPPMFGGNDQVFFLGEFTLEEFYSSISIKGTDGMWQISDAPFYATLDAPAPENIYGNISCHPIAADFDGDGLDDRTVMCPYGWRIAYSGDAYPQFKDNLPFYRAVDTLTYDANEFALPGRSYSGGVSYETTQQILSWYQVHYPNDPPPIPVDMVTISACDLVSGSECQ